MCTITGLLNASIKWGVVNKWYKVGSKVGGLTIFITCFPKFIKIFL